MRRDVTFYTNVAVIVTNGSCCYSYEISTISYAGTVSKAAKHGHC